MLERDLIATVNKLKDYTAFKKLVQPLLRQYVTDKTYPLEDRFQVWSEWCDKIHKGWVIHRGEFGIIGGMVDDCFPYDYERGVTYDFGHFLAGIEDNEYDVTFDQLREILIETNFGSFVMDW